MFISEDIRTYVSNTMLAKLKIRYAIVLLIAVIFMLMQIHRSAKKLTSHCTSPLLTAEKADNHLKWEVSRSCGLTLPSKLKPFQVRVTELDYKIYMDVIANFISTLEKNDMMYFMIGGTLLGALRHRDLIPWDAEVDLIVNTEQISEIQTVLEPLEPDFKFSATDDGCWRFYSTNSEQEGIHEKDWPFINVYEYKSEDGKIYEKSTPDVSYPESIVLPLQKLAFGSLKLSAPSNPEEFLKLSHIDINQCESVEYKRSVIPKQEEITVDCLKLHLYYPFVMKHAATGKDELVYGGAILL